MQNTGKISQAEIDAAENRDSLASYRSILYAILADMAENLRSLRDAGLWVDQPSEIARNLDGYSTVSRQIDTGQCHSYAEYALRDGTPIAGRTLHLAIEEASMLASGHDEALIDEINRVHQESISLDLQRIFSAICKFPAGTPRLRSYTTVQPTSIGGVG